MNIQIQIKFWGRIIHNRMKYGIKILIYYMNLIHVGLNSESNYTQLILKMIENFVSKKRHYLYIDARMYIVIIFFIYLSERSASITMS